MKFQKKPKKKTALVFVDFEYMQISHKNRWGIEPPLHDWYDALCAEYDVKELYVFADFSNSAMKNNLPVLRQITDNIIETQNTASRHKKDFTDFFLLDKIYQKAFEKNKAQTYILFTGDGHFSSAVSFLTTKCGKEVGVYAIKKACSTQLAGCATYTRLLPSDDELTEPSSKYSRMILQSLKRLQEKNKSKTRATFWQTVEAVSKQNKVGKEEVTSSLRTLIAKGYIYQVKESEKPDSIRILKVNWQQVYKDRLL